VRFLELLPAFIGGTPPRETYAHCFVARDNHCSADRHAFCGRAGH